ncbi:hypothetical protein DU475_00420 [Rhodopseudomonas sp. WA056]|uniref:hypothetical protein n=1 Tax=Rhodopseudomonas sp. WA056 TaxID=2269367 RepID=UPI0013DF5A0D|nr:hypothetical protein [Rhodopseudomonas sp. WA056]NEW85727.1 hypothetical protein [Rhodopseudomonas sp. WA056]
MTASEVEALHGFLFAKLAAIGSRSETPIYYLQQFDDSDHRVAVDGKLFHDEPTLRPYLATKVTVTGTQGPEYFQVASITRCSPETDGCVINWGD